MNRIYKFSLTIIILIFIFLESSEFSRISSPQDTSNSNTNVILEKSLNLKNKQYLIDESSDLNKIKQVSNKIKKKEQNSEIEELDTSTKTKTLSGKSSIYVQAFQSILGSNIRSPYQSWPFNLKDSRTGNFIRPTSMLEAHITCNSEVLKLPRIIERQDRKIKFGSDFFDMFVKQYEKVFGYNLILEENVSKEANRKRVKRAEKRLFKTYGSKSEAYLRGRLFENPTVIKALGCRYREKSGFVIIYYDFLSDLFAIVDSQSNKLLEFGVASEIDYVDIFRYKSIFQEKTAGELLQCPSEELNPFQPTCPIEEGPLRRDIPLTEEDRSLNLNDFDKIKNKGLPQNYNIIDGWWLNREKEIISSLDPDRFAQLSIEIRDSGPVKTPITRIEALTVLQAERQNLIGGISRPDMLNDIKEAKLNFDFKISRWNQQIFIGWKPTYVDIKAPLDPEVIRARGEPYQTLEDQVDNLLKTISLQRKRAIENNESVIHIITLLRIKPSDRAYFINNFKTKALKQDLDLNGVKFINTSSDTI